MEFIDYFSSLFYFFQDRRIIKNIEEMSQQMIEKKTIRLFTIAKDKNEYNRYKSLLDGSLKSVLNNEKISQALRKNSTEAMSGQKQITLIHFPSDIRKKPSKKRENIGKVLDLDKNTVNG
jgi:Zn-dependent M16 (insulinase) family peptidase